MTSKEMSAMGKKRNDWTEEETKILKDNIWRTAKELQELLPNRTLHAIYKKRHNLGITEASKLTEEHDAYIKENLNKLSIKEIADYCGVNRTTIERRMKKLDLVPLRHKEDWTLADYQVGYEDGEFSIEYIYEKR